MGHPGKHPIDPATGLCEICDRDAINEVRHGKRPGKQFFYSNHDDRNTYRPNHERIPYEKVIKYLFKIFYLFSILL
jgi:hypothetical protein